MDKDRISIVVFSLGLLLAAGARAFAANSLIGLPDPTRPYTGLPAWNHRPAGLVLQSTLVSPLQRLAVINGRTFKTGERVDDAVILQIHPYGVILSRAGRRQLLRLLPKLNIERTRDENTPLAAIR